MTDKAPERIFLPPADQVPFEDWNLLSEKLDGYDTEYIRKDLAPAVKQLEWEPWYFGDHFARTPFGVFNVKGNMWRKPKKRTKWEGPCADPYAAAQAYFERRVRECLV